MGRIEFDINVRNKDVIYDIQNAIVKGVARGGREIDQEATDLAKRRIRTAGAVFSGDLSESFETRYYSTGERLIVKIENTSDHAGAIEYGAEYTDRGPPVSALIPWVQTKMTGFQVPDDGLADLPGPEERAEELEGEGLAGYNVDVRALADRDVVQKAFWLQQHIKETGIDPLRYMTLAEQWVEADGPRTVEAAISQELRKA